MAELYVGNEFGEVWRDLLGDIIDVGKRSSPRGSETKELLNVSIEVQSAQANILVNNSRDLNYRFMIAEWLWIQAGLNDVDILAQYNSQMRKFSDDGHILSGAYGPRLMPQIPYVLESLSKPDSRQAVATIWTPSPTDSRDIPCTISLQWLLRGGVLHCTANMRSSDVWLGLPYDFFTFSQITNYVAMRMDADIGSLTMNLASSHLYESHYLQADLSYIDSTTTVWSPEIAFDEIVPNSELITRMLNHEMTSLGPLWREYQEALSHSKSHALEVLRGIDPST